ncbi:L,D-transpeptidase [Methylobacterium nodulans]|uniref:ErfK/YbiS/YcfS/YnhG family protein n=1 Tax=Methylobacterium nodulans (strain LMG 21967 / CNCM I-2342 / ORS 2060) TaxID=460265 RepID=B8IDI1_METNO|nr:L,D-transpeptidase [Methylobacterium nodulans]ACL61347.1 ErfK/YbiS/YcfS/YnhG family protein [Methylobacterium nodulans ORS 2060]
MTDQTRRTFVASAVTGLASVLFSTALTGTAGAWPQRYPAPAPEAEPDDDWPFGSRRAVEPEDPFWGGPRRPAPQLQPQEPITAVDDGPIDYARAYAAVTTEPFPVPAFRWQRANPVFLRQEVAYGGRYEPGTVVIDPRARHLYLVQPGGQARRYGVGVGRQGFAWSGVATINSKQAWPDWYPPKEMIARQPDLARQVSQLQSGLGVPGGPRNPLGARAMYLWQNNKDTLYRIHGTTEPETIGRSVSSGCIRMINQDVIDLYARVAIGAQVVVLG